MAIDLTRTATGDRRWLHGLTAERGPLPPEELPLRSDTPLPELQARPAGRMLASTTNLMRSRSRRRGSAGTSGEGNDRKGARPREEVHRQ